MLWLQQSRIHKWSAVALGEGSRKPFPLYSGYNCASGLGGRCIASLPCSLCLSGDLRKMELFTIFLALTSLLLPVLGYNFDTACVDGITTDITEFTFAGGEELDYYTNLCTNNLTVHSVWAAAKVYCTPKQITAGEKLLSGYCEEYGLVKLVPYAEVLPLLTNEFISSLPIVEYSDVDATKILNHSVLISRDFYKAGMHTTVSDIVVQGQCGRALTESRAPSKSNTCFIKDTGAFSYCCKEHNGL